MRVRVRVKCVCVYGWDAWMDGMHGWMGCVHGVCVRLRGGERPVLSVCAGVYVLMRVCVGG